MGYFISNTIILYKLPNIFMVIWQIILPKSLYIKKSKTREFSFKFMKIFHNNIKKGANGSKFISLRKKLVNVGKTLPSFSKEWKNTIYSFDKNILKNIPVNTININKLIKSYFNLYFKNNRFIGDNKIIWNLKLKKRRYGLRRIFVSNAEIKYTNNKAIITLYVVNREKKILAKKYWSLTKTISKHLLKRGYLLFRENIQDIYTILIKYKNPYFFTRDILRKKSFLRYKLTYLNTFLKLKNLYLKKTWSILLNRYSFTSLSLVRKIDLAYSLNQYKFNKLVLLPKLSTILTKILKKKIEYKIINLKSIAYNTDLFTSVLAIKLRNVKNRYTYNISSIFNRAYLPIVNTIAERTSIKFTSLANQYKDSKIISYLFKSTESNTKNLDQLINNTDFRNLQTQALNKNIHSIIYNSIGYKNIAGIRLEVNGRLTKRYRADRAIHFMKWKGGLKNIDSSFRRISSVLFRGNTNSNTSYSLSTGRRRIGAFAVKGWIAGK